MTTLKSAVHPLIREHLTTRPDGKIERAKPLLTQLLEAREPSSGGRRDSSERPLPIDVAAVDLWNELQDDARTEQWHRTRNDSGSLWQIMETWAELEDPEWEAYLIKVALGFRDRINALINPAPKRRPLRERCPACGKRWVKDANGERREGLTAGVFYDDGTLRHPAEYDVHCANCDAQWRGGQLTDVLPRITKGVLLQPADTRRRRITRV